MRINNKHILSMACFGMLAGALASCDTDKTIEYQAAPESKVQPVYFPLQPTQAIELGEEDTELTFNVYRGSLTDPSTVELAWEGDTQMFSSLPTSAVFGEEDLITQVTIEMDPSTFAASTVYNLTVTLPGAQTTPYSQNYINFTFEYFPMSAWEPFMADPSLDRDGFGVFTFAYYYSGQALTYVEWRHSLLDSNQVEYRFQWYIDNDNPSLGFETFLTAASNDGGKTIYVPEQEFAFNANYGTVYVMEAGQYNIQASSGGSYFDDISGTFYLDVIYFVDQGYFGYGYESCTLFGFADTNSYSVSATDAGTVMIDDKSYQLVNFTWSNTVGAVAYTVVNTSSVMGDEDIDEDLVWQVAEGMLSGATQFTQLQDQGLQALTFPSGGNYTVIVAGFKAESNGSATLKATDTLSFTFESVDPNEGWTSLGYLAYTDGYMSSAYGVEPLTYYVEVQENDDNEGYMRLVNPYGADYPYNEEGDWNPRVNSYLYFDIFNPECVYVDYSPQTLNWGDGDLICYSYAALVLANDGDYQDVIDAGANGIYEDKVVTFPFQTLLLAIGEDGWYYANYAVDIDGTNAAGEIVYVLGDDGEPLAPFKIDFNTLTDDPLAAGTRSVFSPSLHKLAPKSLKPAPSMKKRATYVKYNSKKFEVGARTPYRTLQPFNF